MPSSSITVQSLREAIPLSPLSTAIKEASPFLSPGLSSSDFNVGLGLNMDTSATAPVSEAQGSKERRASLLAQGSPKEPSLYAAIFGAAYTRLPSRTQSTPPRPPQAKSLSPHVRQGSSARLEKIASSPRIPQSPNTRQGRPLQKVNSSTSRNLEGLVFAHPTASPSKPRRESAGGSLPVTPSRNRMRSAGGSLLPNGHPASSLAQDLGIASGSVPTSRSASRDRFHTHQTTTTTTPPRSASLSFPDSTFATPQKKRRRSMHADGNEAAAHSLLDLARSPSPYHDRHLDRFAGATPSLEGLVREQEEDPRQGPSPGTKLIELHEMGSPPLTPPRSNRLHRITFDVEAGSEEDSSPCSTLNRTGSLVLLSDPDLEQDRKDNKASRHVSEPLQAPPQDSISYISETPRTPPPLSAPSTPKAPGSHFWYGEYLHTSPSPQPRMRINSTNSTPKLSSLQGTPTRGTKSSARFFGSLSNDLDDRKAVAPLTELELSDILVPGKQILEPSPRIGSGSFKKAKIYS